MSHTVALEPDEARWKECYRLHHQIPDCEVLCQTTTEYLSENPTRKFDLIVVGMVLQHLSTSACERLLEETASLLKTDGIAVIYTTHTLEETKGFSFSGDGSRVYVSKQEFDDYTESSLAAQTKGLPFRRFSKRELLASVSRNFEPIYWRQCSYYDEQGLAFFSNRLRVEPEQLRNTGNSQFVLVRKLS